MAHITLYRLRNAHTNTFINLTEAEAMTLVDLVSTSDQFLITDASRDIAPRIPSRIRTSWYTRDLPEES